MSESDWFKFYQQSFSSSVSDATTVTTSATATELSPEGRVSKPIRRRSRASRRTPTTLLNTDTTNFRAMVQQFTGGSHALPLHNNLGLGSRAVRVNPSQHTYTYTYGGGGDNAYFQRLISNPTPTVTATPSHVNVVDDGGARFFPTTSTSLF